MSKPKIEYRTVLQGAIMRTRGGTSGVFFLGDRGPFHAGDGDLVHEHYVRGDSEESVRNRIEKTCTAHCAIHGLDHAVVLLRMGVIRADKDSPDAAKNGLPYCVSTTCHGSGYLYAIVGIYGCAKSHGRESREVVFDPHAAMLDAA